MIISKEHINNIPGAGYVNLNEAKAYRKEGMKSINACHENDKQVIFLSHKHSESEILKKVVRLIKNCGADVYIDWMDEGMPQSTCGKTAIRIKDKIKSCDKFILIGTEGAISSKWCNWELGIGDVRKHDDFALAVLPIKEDYKDYSGNEYLELYPTIQYQDGTSKYIYTDKHENINIYVLRMKNGNHKVKGQIPKGYYVHMNMETDNGTAYFLIRLKDWLSIENV